MDKIKVEFGGHHFTGDDLLYLQDALKKGLLEMAKSTGETFIAISGCEVSPGATIDWTPGIILMNGELVLVDGGSLPYPANTTFQIVETNDVAGDQQYEDLNNEHTYVKRRAVISGNAGGAFYYSNLKHLKDYYLPPGMQEQLASMQIGTGWALNSPDVFIWKSRLGEVMFQGSITCSSTNSTTKAVLINIPNNIDYLPNSIYTVSCAAIVAGVYTVVHLEISPVTETIKLLGVPNGTAVTVFLDDLKWPFN